MEPWVTKVLELALAVQQIPAPTFHEARRAAFVRARWEEEGAPVTTDEVGNVYARLPGKGEAPPVIVVAHLDTVFPLDADLTVRQEGSRWYGPGLGDNSLGVAALFGLYWRLRAQPPLPGDVWLVADVGEEGLGNLRGMRAVMARFGGQVTAYVILEGLGLGQVYHRALGVRRFRIRLRTAGGHAWSDQGAPSAVHEAARLVTRLTALPLPSAPRTALNVGRLVGGVSVNTIAPEAWLEVDLRSEDPQVLARWASQVERLAHRHAREGVAVEVEAVGYRPAGALPATHPLVQAAERALQAQGVSPVRVVGSTDANLPLSRGYPAVGLGLTLGGGAHTLEEYIEIPPLAQGLRAALQLVRTVWTPWGGPS